MKKWVILLAVLVCSHSANSQTINNKRVTPLGAKNSVSPPAANATTLPIRKVILYSNGVAYIERRGHVSGNTEINLSFKQSQVDDVLKSMVVLDLGKGKIGAVSYNSSAPASARTAEIPFSVQSSTGDGGGIAAVLSQLQGAKVAITTQNGVVVGSILTVERKQVKLETESVWTSMLVISSENGEISNYDLRTVRGVRLLDEETRKDLNEFASATASARRRDAKTITVTSDGGANREMVVSYTVAAPIWKTTYRVVLDADGKPFFQGWAIVDNVSEEDWVNVQLSLVSGSPVSFIQNLQKPFYRYRPVVPMPPDLQLQPQVHEPGGASVSSSISGIVTDMNGAVVPGARVNVRNNSTGESFEAQADAFGRFQRSGLRAGTYSVTVEAPGFRRTLVSSVALGSRLNVELNAGGVSETVEVSGADATLNTVDATVGTLITGRSLSSMPGVSISTALMSGESGIEAAAVGEEIGDLFQYSIEHPITVMRDRSALIPIIQTKMDGERVSVYNASVRMDRPYSGVLLKNDSALTFETGSMTVLDGDAYAGEAMMERLKPKEERLISFALDLGTLVRVRDNSNRETARIIKIFDGMFQAHYFRSEEKIYQLTNQSERKRVVYVEHPIRSGWLLGDGPKPDSTTQRFYRFRVELKPMEEVELKVSERQPLMESYQLAALSRADLDMFVSRSYIDAALRARLEKLLVLRSSIVQAQQKLQALNIEIGNITNDQKRLRENIETLSKTPEAKTLITRYINKANEQETRLEDIANERKALDAERDRLERELAVEIKNFEVK